MTMPKNTQQKHFGKIYLRCQRIVVFITFVDVAVGAATLPLFSPSISTVIFENADDAAVRTRKQKLFLCSWDYSAER